MVGLYLIVRKARHARWRAGRKSLWMLDYLTNTSRSRSKEWATSYRSQGKNENNSDRIVRRDAHPLNSVYFRLQHPLPIFSKPQRFTSRRANGTCATFLGSCIQRITGSCQKPQSKGNSPKRDGVYGAARTKFCGSLATLNYRRRPGKTGHRSRTCRRQRRKKTPPGLVRRRKARGN